jgi:hypothetical protein
MIGPACRALRVIAKSCEDVFTRLWLSRGAQRA